MTQFGYTNSNLFYPTQILSLFNPFKWELVKKKPHISKNKHEPSKVQDSSRHKSIKQMNHSKLYFRVKVKL